MKGLIRSLILIAFLQFFAVNAKADCDFNMFVTAQPATCQNNGQIQVTVDGPDVGLLDLINAEYSIQSVNTTFQTEFARWTNGIYSYMPPGTYVVKMRVYCSLSDKWETRTSASNIVIDGNYEPIEYASISVRRNALNCIPKTGQAQITIDGGSSPYVIKFIQKPASFDKDSIVVSMQSGSTYLIDSLTAGSYKITVTDACDYTFIPASSSFNISTVSSDIPTTSHLSSIISYLYNYNYTNNPGCNNITYSINGYSSSYELNIYWNSYRSQFYEISFTVNGQQTPWYNMGSAVTLPYSYRHIRTYGYTIYYTVRLKPSLVGNNCASSPPSRTGAISLPSINFIMTFYDAGICNSTRFYFSVHSNYGVLCYPYTWTLTTTANQNDTLSSGTVSNNNTQYPSIQLTRGVSYRFTARDSEGQTYTTTLNPPTTNKGQAFSSYYNNDTYGYPYNDPTIPLGGSNFYIYVNPNHGFPIEPGTKIEYVSGPANAMLNPFFGGPGSVYTIPAGYNSSSFYPWEPNAYGNNYHYISPGTYTFKITNTCGTSTTFSWTRSAIFAQQQDDFSYTIQETCDGITIYPVGHINILSSNGTTFSTSQISGYFRVSGPLYGNCSSGGSITLSRKGNYTINMGYSSSYSTLFPKTFNYGKTNVVLDPDYNMAFACSSTEDAYLKIQAKNGVPPYTYEILGSNLPPNQTGEFIYGHGGETHLIRITDVCGIASFIIPLTILDLTSASITYAYNNGIVCEGGEIGVNCVNLGDGATYHWTGPNNFESYDRMPRILSAELNMEGWYKIEVMPEYCKNPVIDSVYVEVRPRPLIPTVTNDTVLLCYPTGNQYIASLFDVTSTSDMPLRWYDQWNNYIASPEQTMLPNQTGTHTYYISYGYGGVCESNKLRLTVKVQQSQNFKIDNISAFICEDGSVATVKAQASGGVPPYTYEILGSGLSNNMGIFLYGQAGQTYQMRVTDYCSGNITVPFTVISNNLFTVDTIRNCMYSNIIMSCADVGDVSYEWTGPGGFVAHDRQFIITGATSANIGWYKVRVTPDGCDDEIKDSVYLQLYPQASAPIVANDTLYYCYYHSEGNTIVYDTLHVQTDAGITACCPLKWYYNQGDINPVSYDMDNLPVTDIGSGTRTFYVSQGYALTCESDKVPVTIIFRTGSHIMDKEKSYAYACSATATANIHIEAKDGIAPYRYEIPGSGLQVNTTGDFAYGLGGHTYPVIIYDACGIAKTDSITVITITTGAVTDPKEWYYCKGGEIHLNAINIGEGATYSWTGPSGFTSNLKNPVIYNAIALHSGTYYLSFTPAGCSAAVTDTVEAIMIPALAAPTVAYPALTFCGTEGIISLDTAAGVSAVYPLHWYNSLTSNIEVSPVINLLNLSNNTTVYYYVSQGASDVNDCQSSRVQVSVTIQSRFVENTYFNDTRFSYCPNEIPEPLGTGNIPYIYKHDGSGIDNTAVFTYQWQYYNGILDDDGNGMIASNWVDIPGATSDSLFFTQPLTQTTWFRRVVYATGLYSCGSNILPGYWYSSIRVALVTPPSGLNFNIQPNIDGIVFVKDYAGHGWSVPVDADGSSWAKAYPGLADPLYLAHLDRCSGNIKEIHVAAGTYYPLYVINDDSQNNSYMTDRNRSFVLVKGVKLYGGFPENAVDGIDYIDHASGIDTRNLTDPANKTVLSGDIGAPDNVSDNVYHVVVGVDIPYYETETTELRNTVFDGFTITGGNASCGDENVINGQWIYSCEGGGIFTYYAYHVMKNLTITENYAEYGGGISMNGKGTEAYNPSSSSSYIIDKPVTLTNSYIIKNRSLYSGGGIRVYASNLVLQNCNISENVSEYSGNYAYGGGMSLEYGVTSLNNVIISKNRVGGAYGYGGGIYSGWASQFKMVNVRITGNTSVTYGGGICIETDTYYAFPDPYKKVYNFANVTIADNTADMQGGGIWGSNYYDASNGLSANDVRGKITNSIFWGNSANEGADIFQNGDLFPAISYSIVNGCFNGCDDNPIGINGGNIKTTNPLFVDPVNDDYTLSECSPAIDAGLNSDPLLTGVMYDLAGNSRIVNSKVDMGAYEYTVNTTTTPILYVDYTATGSNDGTSWSNAFTSFADAVKKANCGGNVSHILVAAGVYHPEYDDQYNTYLNSSATGATRRAFIFTNNLNGLNVLGGYNNGLYDDTSPEQTYYITSYVRNPRLHESILSGDFDDDDNIDGLGLPVITGKNAGHVIITVNADATLVFDGLTITGGNASYGEGYIYQIDGNIIDYYSGGGVYNCESSPTFNDVLITRNRANSLGGGIYNTSLTPSAINMLTPTFTNSVISYNRAFNGAGAYNEYSNAVYKNVIISRNRSDNAGAGVFNGGASAVFINAVIDNNIAGGTQGSAITNDKKLSAWNIEPLFINLTVVDNTSTAAGIVDGFGLFNIGGVDALVYNSIFWLCGSGNSVINSGSSTTNFEYSLVEGSAIGYYDGVMYEPLFNPDYSLDPAGFGIGRGDNDLYLTTTFAGATDLDVAGNSRFSGQIDLGAFEHTMAEAMNDTVHVFKNSSDNEIHVLDNDNFSCEYPVVNIVVMPKHGQASSNGVISYEPDGGYTGRDSIRYALLCGTVSDTAWLQIYVDDIYLSSNSICVGNTAQLYPATGITWVSAYPGVATVDPSTGLIIGISQGTSYFIATNSDGFSGFSPPLTVSECYNITVSCDDMPYAINILDYVTLPDGCGAPVVSVTTQPAHGTTSVSGTNIIYSGNLSVVDSLTFRVICGAFVSEIKLYFTINPSLSGFVDDIWYFGRNGQGIRFVNNNGVYSVMDASGESKVDSHENSLVVSSPYCDGQKIFYASHHQLYNSQHELMAHGHFMGYESVADGLAACYMGNNKYLFFSVTGVYETSPRHIGLKAYIIDMNADNGKGDIVDSVDIENASANMSESIELIAAAEAHKYWLVYAYKNGTYYDLHVRPIDVTSSNPVGNVLSQTIQTSSTYNPYTLKVSPQYDKIALANGDEKTVDVFDFDNSTGVISNQRTTSTAYAERIEGIAYGVEFSPDGNQLYAAGYTTAGGSPVLCQYTIHSGSLEFKDRIKYWTQTAYNTKGSGMKLGPDGRIYVKLAYDSNIGVISNPNATTALLDRYDNTGIAPNGFHVNVTVDSYALRFSTGLTKPSIMECNTNKAPVTSLDETEFCITATLQTTKVNVLLNDSDPENNTIFLTDAVFVNPADTLLATLTVNAADSTVTLTVKPNAYLGIGGHVFDVVYDVKDDGLPASQCATGSLRITAHPTPNYPDIRVHVCPDAGVINLSKYLDTINGVKTNDIQWTSQISGIPITSPAGTVSTNNFHSANVYTFMYTISSMCVTEQTRKVYLDVLKNSRQPKLRDTVVICYKYAEAIQLNQLFGIEAPGTWIYPSDIELYIRKSSSPVHNGATVMDGKGIYENVASLEDEYHGRTVKIVDMTYKTDDNSCLHGKQYTVTIVLTDDILN